MIHRTIAAFALAAALAAGSLIFTFRPPAVTAAQPAPPTVPSATASDLRSTVTVVGDGRVTTQPDLALVTFGVEANGQTLAEAQADGATRMQAVIDGLIGLGIPREDIRTSRISANPVYDPKDNTVIRGYRASNSVQVKLRELGRVGQIVDAMTAAGANRVEGLSFSVEKIEEPKNQARALAVQNGRGKADQLASLAGMRVVAVKAIQESDASSAPPQAPQPMAARAEGMAAPPVEPGAQEVRTQVTVTYIIE
jgi:uncharacterized protein